MPDTPTLTVDDLADLKARLDVGALQLISGHGDFARDKTGCAMDLIAWRAAGEITDRPSCVHPLIAGHIHKLNDADGATAESRWEIVEHAGPVILGTDSMPSAHVAFALLGAEDGAAIAAGITKIREAGPGAALREWVEQFSATTGDEAHAATTGDEAHAATTGGWAHAATTGDWAHAATTGDWAHAATTGGWAHAATTGDGAHAATTGSNTIAAALNGGYARSGPDGTIVAAYRDTAGKRRLVIGYVGENGILADTWYRATTAGELEQVPAVECPNESFIPVAAK